MGRLREGAHHDSGRELWVGPLLAKNMGRPHALTPGSPKNKKDAAQAQCAGWAARAQRGIGFCTDANWRTRERRRETQTHLMSAAVSPAPSSSTRPPFHRCLLDRRPHWEPPAFHKPCFRAKGCLLLPGPRSPVMPTEGHRKHLSLYRADPDHFRS